jgi:NCS1 family nucleobase:cation symporter-1
MFWLINLYFVYAGTESIKWLETAAAPFLVLVGLALLWWAVAAVGGFRAVFAGSATLSSAAPRTGWDFVTGLFVPWVTAMVGYWATLALNIPDFTRYARSQRDQAVGQAVGLLTTMPLFAFIGIAVTSATVVLYGRAIWNPVELIGRLATDAGSPLLGLLALVAILVATLTTNIAANVVAPANAFSNLSPRRIGFRLGGLITAVVGIAIMPWRLLDAYQGWLISYSGLLGAVAGVLVCDYAFVRRGRLRLGDLYRVGGEYAYRRGINPRAMLALGVGVLVPLAGLAHPALAFLFNGAWFSGSIAAFAAYRFLMATPVAAAESGR